MVTTSQFRALALSLPGAEEKSHFSKADFRVQGKIFAGLAAGKAPVPGAGPERGYFKARPELRDELSGSAAFTPAEGAWGRSGWTYVELPQVKAALLSELLLDSWKLVAPASLVAAREGSPARARKKRRR
jgi:predicted DNA-binding protein (MmcQ/YjbR family)